MFKDLVVPITGTSGDAHALNAALDLATATGAHVSVLEMLSMPMPLADPWGMTPDLGMGDLYGKLRAQAQINVDKLKTRLEKESVSTEVRLIESLFVDPSRMAAHCAHYADLTVVAGSFGGAADAAVAHAYLGSLLLESGRPVLVVPPGCKTPMPPRRIVVAWRPSREATRALHDAMSLLRNAEVVDVAVVDPAGGETGHGEQPGADIATHLARNGVNPRVVVCASNGLAISAVLLEHARQADASLIVAGGYGHTRFREWALGGVTRELLMAAPIPVLFSH